MTIPQFLNQKSDLFGFLCGDHASTSLCFENGVGVGAQIGFAANQQQRHVWSTVVRDFCDAIRSLLRTKLQQEHQQQRLPGYHLERTFSNEVRDATLKHTRNTSVPG